MVNDGSKTGRDGLAAFDGSDAALDALFAEMRAAGPVPSEDLMARILGDAEAAMPGMRPAMTAPGVARRPAGGLRGLFAALGGWGGVGGLVSATVAGVWIGFADLGTGIGISSLTAASGTNAATTVELLPGADAFATADATGG